MDYKGQGELAMDGYDILKDLKNNLAAEIRELHQKENEILKSLKKENSNTDINVHDAVWKDIKDGMEKVNKDKYTGKALGDSLWAIASDYEIYRKDMLVAIYMFYGSINTKASGLGNAVLSIYDEIIPKEEKIKDNENSIGRYFCFKIEEKISEGGYSDKYITEWCRMYQETLWNKDNKSIFKFSHKNDKEDISRYGYIKTENIYNELKEREIENLLMFEMTLGFGLTNVIYEYLEDVGYLKAIQNLDPLIKEICGIPGLNMKKRIAEVVFYHMKKNGFGKNDKENIEKISELRNILKEVTKEIKKNYRDCLKTGYIYFHEKIKRSKNIFDKAIILYSLWEEIKEEHEKFWDDYESSDFSIIVNRGYYEKLKILKVHDIYSEIQRCKELYEKIEKYEYQKGELYIALEKIQSDIFRSDIFDLKEILCSRQNKTKFVSNMEPWEIVRSKGSEECKNIREKNDLKHENGDMKKQIWDKIEKLEKLVEKQIENRREKLSRDIKLPKDIDKDDAWRKDANLKTGYAFLHKIIVYHLMENMSSDEKIPANL